MIQSVLRRAAAPCALAITFAGAQARGADKSVYSLFNPTPTAQMREMITDRPSRTQTAYTVDAGHYQIETDVVTYEHDETSSEGRRTKKQNFTANQIALKAGLLNALELQVALESHVIDHVTEDGERRTKEGLGDTSLRLKYNFFGNDDGGVSLSAFSFVIIPTSAKDLGTDQLGYGFGVPLTVALAPKWSLNLMAQLSNDQNEVGTGRHTTFVTSWAVYHQFVRWFGAYAEYYSKIASEHGAAWEATADLGTVFTVSENFDFDAGVNFGLTDATNDYNPFVGLSLRF